LRTALVNISYRFFMSKSNAIADKRHYLLRKGLEGKVGRGAQSPKNLTVATEVVVRLLNY